MSVDFTLTLAAKDQDPFAVLRKSVELFGKLQFCVSRTANRVEFDNRRGVFEETEQGEVQVEPLDMERFLSVQDWSGLSVEFNSQDTIIYLLVARAPNHYTNCYVDISGRTLQRLAANDQLSVAYAVFLAAARACDADGGFGQYEQPFAPISPTNVVRGIRDNPEMPGIPSGCGLIRLDEMTQQEVESFAGEDYEVIQTTSGYWVLRHVDGIA